MPRLDASPHVLVPVSWQILLFVAVFATAVAVVLRVLCSLLPVPCNQLHVPLHMGGAFVAFTK